MYFSSFPSQRQLSVELTPLSSSWITGRATSTRPPPPPRQSQQPPLHHLRSKLNTRSVVEVNNSFSQKLPFTDDLSNTHSMNFLLSKVLQYRPTLRYDTRWVLLSKSVPRETVSRQQQYLSTDIFWSTDISTTMISLAEKEAWVMKWILYQ